MNDFKKDDVIICVRNLHKGEGIYLSPFIGKVYKIERVTDYPVSGGEIWLDCEGESVSYLSDDFIPIRLIDNKLVKFIFGLKG